MCKAALCVLLGTLALQVVGQTHNDDDKLCWDKDKNKAVKTKDCDHGCCVDGDCGSKSECDTVHVVLIVVGVGAAVIFCVFLVVAFLWWRKMCCFEKKEPSPSEQAVLAYPCHPTPYANQYPQQGHPMVYGTPAPANQF
eukprot:TRINITY_DN2386_c0_g1_i4.p1 TRINITY_DN2386_c0_g1~~TRINITY_DN2386_c0_g1_i4.p1  ORF type:complete len:158 (+),score=34.86 TRINITY_DN2386_c0_g1_i4:58-474(+)